MYTITLANGKKLTGLDMNGTNYVSKEKVDETIFKDNLSTMKVSDGETDTKVKVNDLSERVVMVEQSTKSAHHRLDRYEEEEIYHGKPRKRWWV